MTYVGAIFLVVGFMAIVFGLGAVSRAKEVIDRSRQALADLKNAELHDDEKERLIQGHAIRLFALFFMLVGIGVLGLGAPTLVLWLADQLGWVSFHDVMALTVSWKFLVVVSVVCILVMWVGSSMGGGGAQANEEFENRYTLSDRLLHHVVFSTVSAQVACADMEDWRHGKALDKVELDRPLFVTALPRAGTTMLLDLLAELPGLAAHCYRDMPFVRCPVLWNALAQRFRKEDKPRERAHGDGMMVSLDSPEAFEEMVWIAFWQKHYKSDRITTWSECKDRDFLDFFRSHMRKIIWLRTRPGHADGVRYVSKNNVNIARLAALPAAIRSCIILVPYRDPVQHAQSMLRQHLRFTKIHAHDAFARTYMAGVGHFDFGASLKPIDFDGWLDEPGPSDPLKLPFWIRYWTVAYEVVLRQLGPQVRLLGYDRLCSDPADGVEKLIERAEVRDADELRTASRILKAPSRREVDTSGVDKDILDRAMDVFERLNRTAD